MKIRFLQEELRYASFRFENPKKKFEKEYGNVGVRNSSFFGLKKRFSFFLESVESLG